MLLILVFLSIIHQVPNWIDFPGALMSYRNSTARIFRSKVVCTHQYHTHLYHSEVKNGRTYELTDHSGVILFIRREI